ncbi:zinc metalloprotease [Pelomyxa schiedti]|nr:zinc metalloprotease [Pelomyxa schiedti]
MGTYKPLFSVDRYTDTATQTTDVRCPYDSWKCTQRAEWDEMAAAEPSLLECNINDKCQVVGTMDLPLNIFPQPASEDALAQQPVRVDLVRNTRTGIVTPLIWGDVMVPWMMLCDAGVCANPVGYKYGGSASMGGLWQDGKLYYCLSWKYLSQEQLEELKEILLCQKKTEKNPKTKIARNIDIDLFLKEGLLDKELTNTVKEGIKLITQSQNSVQFVEQTNGTYPPEHCVVFLKDDMNCSCVGQIGFPVQPIRLTKNASPGNVAHEILHALGFHHTHSRFDRDKYVHIHKENINEGYEWHFEKAPAKEFDIQEYDYSSIMHYPAVAFPKEPELVTIEVIGHKGIHIGQREALSAGDIASLSTRYPGQIHCTYKSMAPHQQAWFRCQTCWGPGDYGCCMACALSCHKGHYTIDVGPANAFCHCGALHHRYKCTRFADGETVVKQLVWRRRSGDGLLCYHCAKICPNSAATVQETTQTTHQLNPSPV